MRAHAMAISVVVATIWASVSFASPPERKAPEMPFGDRELDPTHAVTVGAASSDNSAVIELVDGLSCHSYDQSSAVSLDFLHPTAGRVGKQSEVGVGTWLVSSHAT